MCFLIRVVRGVRDIFFTLTNHPALTILDIGVFFAKQVGKSTPPHLKLLLGEQFQGLRGVECAA
jgi:hypothetical protein